MLDVQEKETSQLAVEAAKGMHFLDQRINFWGEDRHSPMEDVRQRMISQLPVDHLGLGPLGQPLPQLVEPPLLFVPDREMES